MRFDFVKIKTRSGRLASRISLEYNGPKANDTHIGKNGKHKLQKEKNERTKIDNNKIKPNTSARIKSKHDPLENLIKTVGQKTVTRNGTRKNDNLQNMNNNNLSESVNSNKALRQLKLRSKACKSQPEAMNESETENYLNTSVTRNRSTSKVTLRGSKQMLKNIDSKCNKKNEQINSSMASVKKTGQNLKKMDISNLLQAKEQWSNKRSRLRTVSLLDQSAEALSVTNLNKISKCNGLENRRQSMRLKSRIEFQGATTSTPKKIATNGEELKKITSINRFINSTDLFKINNNEAKPDENKGDNTPNKCKIKANKQISKKSPSVKIKQNIIKSPPKKVAFQNSVKSLRPRNRNRQYKELVNSASIKTDDDTEEEHKIDMQNIPVYKKPIVTHEKKKKDIYDFDNESSQSDSDNDYDKDILGEMKLIKKLERQENKNAILKRTKKYEKNIKSLPHKIVDKIKCDNITTAPKNKQIARKVTILNNIQLNSKTNHVCLNISNLENSKSNSAKKNSKNEIVEIEQSFMEPEAMDNIPLEETNVVSTFPITRKSFEAYDSFCQPMANSTMNQLTSSPWRPCLKYRNGPHILQTKKSNLPAFNQDMVLNSTIVDGAHETLKQNDNKSCPQKDDIVSPARVSKRNKSKQTSILSFIACSVSQEADMNCTLFDENLLLSPVKQSKLEDIPVLDLNNSFNEKRALRDRTNLMHSIIATPERDVSDVEFFALSGQMEVAPMGKPTRFLLPSPNKRTRGKETKKEEIKNSSVFESPDTPLKTNETEINKSVVGLFEDCEELHTTREGLPSFTYERKRKRARKVSFVSDEEEPDDESHRDEVKKRHRKKKDEMTKKEQEDMNKWAKHFNHMCEEVDEFTLEVE